MRQLIVARKDLEMGPGKFTAQAAHAAMAFLTFLMREPGAVRDCGDHYERTVSLPRETYGQWVCGIYTKFGL